MKHEQHRLRVAVNLLFLLISMVVIIGTVYYGSTPRQYALQAGDISPYDITAPRDIADEAETVRRALAEMSQVPNIMLRSQERSEESQERARSLILLVREKRDALYREPVVEVYPLPGEEGQPAETSAETEETRRRRPDSHEIELAVSSLISASDQSIGIVIPSGDADHLIRMEEDRFEHFSALLFAESGAVVAKTLDSDGLTAAIAESVERLAASMEFYADDAALVGRMMTLLIQPNVEFNQEATEKAKNAAYERVVNNPVMINRGVRIISQGDVITPELKAMLDELNLTVSARLDWVRLASLLGLVFLVGLISFIFFARYSKDLIFSAPRNMLALVLALLIPLFMSAYLARDYPLAPPVYFAAVVITAYFGLRTSIFLCAMLTILVMPMTAFNPSFPIVALLGSTLAALLTKGTGRHDNYARMILATSFVNAAAAITIGLLQKDSWSMITSFSLQATISGALSVIIGIGIMPLFELIFNTVSPLRLIELSQPGHPLMKRLFVEAPGTSQHSMIVGNLADKAAEAIGASPMIASVGAYFHDVGKLEAPLMFTENQTGDNPHDRLTPLESARIITRHPEDSLLLGRKYRLPQPLLR
ncbi:MAG: HDIG domain-containing protein, partial [Clostridiaceae bacterium]|nr:HDIG domain-containing protein [Clostridiaceae bacterium]